MSPQRFDVIVIGARHASAGAIAQLATVLAQRHGLPAAAVTLGLNHGGVEVHRGLMREDAEVAARALQQIGAVTDIRLARDLSGVLSLEPDSSDALLLVGVPPEEDEAALPPAPPFGIVPSTRATGPQPVMQSTQATRATGPQPVMRGTGPQPVVRGTGPQPVVRGTSPAIEVQRAAPTNEPPTSPPRHTTGSRAAASDAAASASPPRHTTGSRAAVAEPADSMSGSDGRFAPSLADDRLELDLAAAGLRTSPVGTTALSRGQRVAGAPPPPEPVVAATSASFGAVETRDEGLLVPDRISSILIAAAMGAAIGLFVALGWVRGDANRITEKLEAELQTSIADPIAVEEGRMRQPDAIVTELEGGLDDTRSTFMMVWVVVTLPMAAVGAIPRPRR